MRCPVFHLLRLLLGAAALAVLPTLLTACEENMTGGGGTKPVDPPPPPPAKLYWFESDIWSSGTERTKRVRRAEQDGTGVVDVVTLPGEAAHAAQFLTVHRGETYWYAKQQGQSGKVWRAAGASSAVPVLEIAQDQVTHLTAHGDHFYWPSVSIGSTTPISIVDRGLQRARLDGTGVETVRQGRPDVWHMSFAFGGDDTVCWIEAADVAVSDDLSYVQKLRCGNLDGTGAEDLFVSERIRSSSLVKTGVSVEHPLIHAGRVYWLRKEPVAGRLSTTLKRADFDGGNEETVLDLGSHSYSSVVGTPEAVNHFGVHASGVYWVETYCAPTDRGGCPRVGSADRFWRADLDGGNRTKLFELEALVVGSFLVVDG